MNEDLRDFLNLKEYGIMEYDMTVVYQFDGEEEKTLAFEYRVECRKCHWVSPFMGW